jgi:glycosyltransferase involved in cell wall biosynthesis/O-antigen/teichoic acid export membrane protein
MDFARGVTCTSLGALVGIVLDFLGFVVAVHSVSKADFGIFCLFLMVGRFGQVLCDFGVRQAIVQRLSTDAEDHEGWFGSAWTMQTVISGVIAASALLLFHWLGTRFFPAYLPARFGLYVCILVLVQAWHQLLSGTLQGLRLYTRYIAGELTRSAARLVLLLGLSHFLEPGSEGLMIATVTAIAVAVLCQAGLTPLSKRFVGFNGKWWKTLKFAAPLGLNGLLSILFDRLNRFFLALWSGPQAVALLETASRVPDACIQVYLGFQSAFFPSMAALVASGDRDRAVATLNRTLRLVVSAAATVAIVPMMLRKECLGFLFSASYQEASDAFGVLLAGLAIALCNNLLHTTLIAVGSSSGALQAGMFQGGVTVIFYLILIPAYGLLGATWSYVAGNLLVNPVLVALLRKAGVRLNVIDYAKPLLLLVTAATSVFLTAPSLGSVPIALIVFVSAMFLLGCVTPTDCRALLQLRRPPRCAQQRLGPHEGRRLRILILTDRYPPHHEGGYEIACQRTADLLRERGHIVHVVTSTCGLDKPHVDHVISRVLHRLPPEGRPSFHVRYAWRQVCRARLLRINRATALRITRHFSPDVVFVWQSEGMGVGTPLYLQRAGYRVVHRRDDEALADLLDRLSTEGRAFWRFCRRLLYGVKSSELSFPNVIVISRYLRERYLKSGLAGEQLTVIPNGVPAWAISPEKENRNRDSIPFRLLFAGRVCESKGVHIAVEALAHLLKTVTVPVTLDIVGPAAPEYVNHLRCLASSYQITNAITISRVREPNEMLRLYDSYDVLIFPSLAPEGFGLTLIEAMARGVPAIAVDCGGPVDIVSHGEDGLLVPRGDANAIARAVIRLVSNRSLYTSIASKAKDKVRKSFTLEQTVKQIEQYLWAID